MAKITYDDILSMIYDAPPCERANAVFTCDPETFCELRTIHDGDGRYIVEWPVQKKDPPRIFGIPVIVEQGHSGLTFGVRAVRVQM